MEGLEIYEHAQVMLVDGVPIEGLCAVGEIAKRVHGAGRLGSCATLDCLAFGCIVGRTAVCLADKIA